MKNRKSSVVLGLVLLLVVLALTIAYSLYQKNQQPTSQIVGFVGGEKINFLQDPQVEKILADRYHLSIDIRKSGSLDMVRADHSKMDFLWPSSQTALELYKSLHGSPHKEDMIFTTPLVLYSFKPIAEALVEHDYASFRDGVYRLDLQAFIQLIKEDGKWSDLGLDLWGDILIHTTDPAKSNSGNMFAGLTANMLAGGQVVQAKQVAALADDLLHIFNKLGFMSTSSSDLFSLYLRNGITDRTITAAYENQILELSKLQAEIWEKHQDDLVIIYPEPTVWSTHIFIALNEQGARLLEALQDPEIQDLAWQKHGFRTTISGIGDAVTEFSTVAGVAESINKVMPSPDYAAMREIISYFE
ncbi:MAG: substrate-binding domain-containing protein [Eubacteriales bacterium]|nr:substrate-binding domain-containing protein [Eubacteriales bacterium]